MEWKLFLDFFICFVDSFIVLSQLIYTVFDQYYWNLVSCEGVCWPWWSFCLVFTILWDYIPYSDHKWSWWDLSGWFVIGDLAVHLFAYSCRFRSELYVWFRSVRQYDFKNPSTCADFVFPRFSVRGIFLTTPRITFWNRDFMHRDNNIVPISIRFLEKPSLWCPSVENCCGVEWSGYFDRLLIIFIKYDP